MTYVGKFSAHLSFRRKAKNVSQSIFRLNKKCFSNKNKKKNEYEKKRNCGNVSINKISFIYLTLTWRVNFAATYFFSDGFFTMQFIYLLNTLLLEKKEIEIMSH